MAEESASDPQRDRFSVPGVVAGAYRFVLKNRRAFLALAIIPMVVSILVGVPNLVPASAAHVTDLAGALFTAVVSWVCYAVFAVAWSRLILLGGRDTQSPVQFRLGRREARFVLYNLLLMILAIVIMAVLMFLKWIIWDSYFGTGTAMEGINSGPAGNDAVTVVANGIGVIASLVMFIRLAFVFPAIAVDSFKGLRPAWRQTRGIAWRLLWTIIVANIPFVLLSLMVAMLGPEMDESAIPTEASDWLSWLLWTVPYHVLYYVFLAITLSTVCIVFRWRTSWEPPSAPSAEGV